MAPYWRIRRDPLWGLWRVYHFGRRSAAFWTWARCIEYVDQAERALHFGANFGGRL